MRNTHRMIAAAAIALAAATNVLAGAAHADPASTSALEPRAGVTSGPVITAFWCEPLGRWRIGCGVQWTGGTAPISIRWYANGSHAWGWDDQAWMMYGCRPRVSIDVVVSDATGAYDARYGGSAGCYEDPP
jgi:hypothetical protein